MELRLDPVTSPAVIALLEAHLADMYATSPPDSVHALDLPALRQPEVAFWTLWADDALAGCGALRRLGRTHGEIKSMRTADAFRRRGVASRMLRHLMTQAQSEGLERLSLETGAQPYFAPARALYARFGFETTGPFGDYEADPNSVFMTRTLIPA